MLLTFLQAILDSISLISASVRLFITSPPIPCHSNSPIHLAMFFTQTPCHTPLFVSLSLSATSPHTSHELHIAHLCLPHNRQSLHFKQQRSLGLDIKEGLFPSYPYYPVGLVSLLLITSVWFWLWTVFPNNACLSCHLRATFVQLAAHCMHAQLCGRPLIRVHKLLCMQVCVAG